MNKKPLAVIAVFFILGIVLAGFLPDSVGFPHVLILTVIFILLSFIIDSRLPSGKAAGFRGNNKPHRNEKEEVPQPVGAGRITNIFLLLSITSFAALLYINSSIFPNDHIGNVLKEERLKTEMVGVVKSPALTRKPYFGKINSTYLFEIEGIKDNDEWLEVKGLTQIRIQTEKDYGYGDRLLAGGTIKKPVVVAASHAANMDKGHHKMAQLQGRGFNYREYLERQNIFALINTRENNITVLSHGYKSNLILKYTYLIREKLKNQFIEKMPLESGSFLRAILLGDRSELPKHAQASFKNSGTMHLLAISGLHVGLIALVIIFFLRFIRIERGFSYIFTMLFLIFFALLTLSRPSVIRAVVMACVFLTGKLLGRKVDAYNSLGAAALFILVGNPQELFNVGFQLSFVAVIFIVFLTPKFMSAVREGSNFYVKKYIYTPLAVSMSAWLATFPLILYYFRIITPVAIIANLFIIPMLLVLLVGGLAFLLLGWLPFLGAFLANFNNILCQFMFFLADFFASLKFGHFNF